MKEECFEGEVKERRGEERRMLDWVLCAGARESQADI